MRNCNVCGVMCGSCGLIEIVTTLLLHVRTAIKLRVFKLQWVVMTYAHTHTHTHTHTHRMCLRLEDRHYCLSYLTFLGILQSIVALPIIVLSFLVFFWSSLGPTLAPFWCGILVSISRILLNTSEYCCNISEQYFC